MFGLRETEENEKGMKFLIKRKQHYCLVVLDPHFEVQTEVFSDELEFLHVELFVVIWALK